SRAVVMPVIADAKSYRPFVGEVYQRVKQGDKLYLYGDSFNSDPVVFYWGAPIETLREFPTMINNADTAHVYIIMGESDYAEIQNHNRNIAAPLLRSTGTGPEGDARLVLVRS